ncbi:MAG: IS630 family transposase, partial [Gammaproteobacteria bacterium]
GNPDETAQDIFIKQYLDFMENKLSDVEVFFAGAMHPTQNSMAAYGWIKKGQERKLKTNTGRSRFNIHGAMNADTFETSINCEKSYF